MLAFLAGAFGALCAMILFDHKTNHRSFLICANSSEATITAKFDTKEAGISPDVAKVWFEDRTIKLQKGVFEDTFEPNGVHVYELKGLFD